MKTFNIILISLILSSVVEGQPYQNDKEYKTENNTYKCKYKYSISLGLHFYEFTNTKNVLENMNAGLRGDPPSPLVESKRKLLELLCEVYGGKEKMQTMGSEAIGLYCYVGMDFTVKEMRITVSSDTEQPKTTIFQVEAIEKLMKERIRFVFDRDSPYYSNALYDTQGYRYTISEIPALLEKAQ